MNGRIRMVEREPRDMWELPWMRRERADANIRRAIGDLRALAIEDPEFMAAYRAMADAFDASVRLLDAIEDWDSERPGAVVQFA